MAANDRQVGGDHYQKDGDTQHWDMVVQFDLDYFQGQITKYVMRWRDKGGIQDLEKARHFLDKYIEVATKQKLAAEALHSKAHGWNVKQVGDKLVADYGIPSAGGKGISGRQVRPTRKK